MDAVEHCIGRQGVEIARVFLRSSSVAYVVFGLFVHLPSFSTLPLPVTVCVSDVEADVVWSHFCTFYGLFNTEHPSEVSADSRYVSVIGGHMG